MNTFHITNRLLKSTLFCGLLLFSSSALSCSSDDDGGGNGGTQLEWLEPIRVASYNIQYDNRNEEAGRWENRKEIVCRLLEAEDFDIFGAQEPYKFQIEDMAAALPGYTWIGTSVTGEDNVERRHFNPIFYKTDKFEVLESGSFWYSETPNVPNTKFSDSYSPRMCNWAHFRVKATGKEFFHFNSHFDHIGTVARAESAKLLIEKVHEFQKRFLEENGSLLCRQLLGGYDKADPDAVAPDDAYDNCARYCATACRILDSLIGDRYIR